MAHTTRNIENENSGIIFNTRTHTHTKFEREIYSNPSGLNKNKKNTAQRSLSTHHHRFDLLLLLLFLKYYENEKFFKKKRQMYT
jgi:hypothetical protein